MPKSILFSNCVIVLILLNDGLQLETFKGRIGTDDGDVKGEIFVRRFGQFDEGLLVFDVVLIEVEVQEKTGFGRWFEGFLGFFLFCLGLIELGFFTVEVVIIIQAAFLLGKLGELD